MKKIIILSLLCTLSISCKKSDNSTTNQVTQSPDPCEDMDSYNKGVIYGKLQKGGLPDCETYYYEGAANNKDCWCKGFVEGRK